MTARRLYIAGPMTGYPCLNVPAFEQAEVDLELAGYRVLNPARHPQDVDRSWADWMRMGLTDVVAADGVAVLPGWEASRGAVLEVHVAQALALPVMPVTVWLTSARVLASSPPRPRSSRVELIEAGLVRPPACADESMAGRRSGDRP